MKHTNIEVKVLSEGMQPIERDGIVRLSPNKEYSISITNLSYSLKMIASVFIDGDCKSQSGVILRPREVVNLEAPIGSDRKFKTIQVTPEIEAYRGTSSEDGVIRVIYQMAITADESGYSKLVLSTPRRIVSPPHSFHTLNTIVTGGGSFSHQKFRPEVITNVLPEKYEVSLRLLPALPPQNTFTYSFCNLCGNIYGVNDNYCSKDGNALMKRTNHA